MTSQRNLKKEQNICYSRGEFFKSRRIFFKAEDVGRCCWRMMREFVQSSRFHKRHTDPAGLSISHHQEELPGRGSGLALHFGGYLTLLYFLFFFSETRLIMAKFTGEQTTSWVDCWATAVRVTEDVARILSELKIITPQCWRQILLCWVCLLLSIS